MEQISSTACFGGEQQRYKHDSSVLACEMNFSVFMPAGVEEVKAPVLYWLSGLTCTDENFVTKAGAQRYANELGVVIVAPDTSPRGDDVPDDPDGSYDFGLGAGFYVNATQAPWSKNYQMYDYIVEELPALVEANFPVDHARCGIFGHSMGGHGALVIGLRNPERYRSISAFAPIMSSTRCPWGEKALMGYLGDDREAWAQYDASLLLSQTDPKACPPILVDQGGADAFIQEQLKIQFLQEAMVATGCNVKMQVHPGYDHGYHFIATFIERHLKFHVDALS